MIPERFKICKTILTIDLGADISNKYIKKYVGMINIKLRIMASSRRREGEVI